MAEETPKTEEDKTEDDGKKEIEDILAEPSKVEEELGEKEDLDIEEAVSEPEEKEAAVEEEVEETEETETKDEKKEKEPKKEKEKKKPKEKKEKEEPKREEKAKEKKEKDVLERTMDENAASVPQEEGQVKKKPGKKKNLKLIIIIVVAVLVTAALVLGGVYYFLGNKKEEAPQEEPAVEEPVAEEEETPAETLADVYVDAEDGLRLREEPNTNAKILATMPYGTKLTPLEEQGEWIKVEYEGQTGWCMTEFTTEKNPLAYENSQYGFGITFPSGWSGYKLFPVKNSGSDTVITYYVAVPTTDKAWKENDIDAGYASLFVIGVYTKAKWNEVKNQEMHPAYADENSKYVFTWLPAQATPKDTGDLYKQINKVVETLKAK